MKKDDTFLRVISDRLLEFKGFDFIYLTIQINQTEPQKSLVATLSINTGSWAGTKKYKKHRWLVRWLPCAAASANIKITTLLRIKQAHHSSNGKNIIYYIIRSHLMVQKFCFENRVYSKAELVTHDPSGSLSSKLFLHSTSSCHPHVEEEVWLWIQYLVSRPLSVLVACRVHWQYGCTCMCITAFACLSVPVFGSVFVSRLVSLGHLWRLRYRVFGIAVEDCCSSHTW